MTTLENTSSRGARGYKVIEGILNNLEYRYVFTTALACGIRDKDQKMSKKQYAACFQEKLKPLILKYKPRAIVCLGKAAMDAVLQDRSPKTMKEISKTGIPLEYVQDEHEILNSLVLAVDHPARFFFEKVDKNRLAGLYDLIFGKAERFCLETEVRKPVEFTLISSKPAFYELANRKFTEFAFDVENKHNKKDLLRNTIWKRDAKCLSMSITYYEPMSSMYKNFVIVEEALADKFLLKKLFSGRSVDEHNCVISDTLVTLEDGTKETIKSLVSRKYSGRVLTLNEETKCFEYKKVIDWIKGPKRPIEDWLQLSLGGMFNLGITKDHEVITSRGRVQAQNLEVGDLVYTAYEELSETEKALILGSLLGDGSIYKANRCKFNNFKVSHSEKQKAYLDFKVNILRRLDPNVNRTINYRGFSSKNGTVMYSATTKVCAGITALCQNAPLRKKDLKLEDLKCLEDPRVLAIWHCDDGHLSGHKSKICISAYRKYKHLIVYKLESLGFSVSEYIRKDNHVYISIGNGAKSFYEFIAPYIPKCMEYKLPECYRSLINEESWTNTSNIGQKSILLPLTKVRPLLKDANSKRYEGRSKSSFRGIGPTQYCLTVEGNHNFMASNLCISNCKHDSQVLWTSFNFDIFEHAREVHDTLAMFYLSDQNRLNNGLKDLSAKYLGVYDYADTVQRYIVEANNRLRGLKSQAVANYKLLCKKYRLYEELEKWIAKEITVTSQKRKALKALSFEYPSKSALYELVILAKKACDEIPEPGSADYGDIPLDILAQYNAEDTYCTLKLKRELIPYLERIDATVEGPGSTYESLAYKLFQRSLKTICYVERNGLPMDMDSLQEMQVSLISKEAEVQKQLVAVPDVKAAIMSIDKVLKSMDKGKVTEDNLHKQISPTKTKFITKLCKSLKLHDYALLTKGGNYSFTSKKCINNIRDAHKDLDETIHKIFSDLSYIGNNRQVRSKFIKNWEQFWVPESGRFHCNYNII